MWWPFFFLFFFNFFIFFSFFYFIFFLTCYSFIFCLFLFSFFCKVQAPKSSSCLFPCAAGANQSAPVHPAPASETCIVGRFNSESEASTLSHYICSCTSPTHVEELITRISAWPIYLTTVLRVTGPPISQSSIEMDQKLCPNSNSSIFTKHAAEPDPFEKHQVLSVGGLVIAAVANPRLSRSRCNINIGAPDDSNSLV